MSMHDEQGSDETALDATAIIQYLRENPGFFEENSELTAQLRIPHPAGDAVSLVERQMAILRQQNRQLERKLVDLVEIARGNDALVEKMHRLTLALMEAGDLEATVYAAHDHLRSHFGADQVAFCMYPLPDAVELPGTVRVIEREGPAQEAFPNFLESGKPLCGKLKPAQLEFLFGEAADRTASTALVPLGERPELGMLGIGSQRKEAFTPTMGTLYLGRLGELIGCALRRFL